jgi:beta-phosphoglucomutase-like phosphatase (HAD superfamily)
MSLLSFNRPFFPLCFAPLLLHSLCHELENAFNELAATDLECLPGVYQLMDLLEKKNVKKALVTNAPPSEMHFAVNVLKLTGRFDTQALVFGSSTGFVFESRK